MASVNLYEFWKQITEPVRQAYLSPHHLDLIILSLEARLREIEERLDINDGKKKNAEEITSGEG